MGHISQKEEDVSIATEVEKERRDKRKRGGHPRTVTNRQRRSEEEQGCATRSEVCLSNQEHSLYLVCSPGGTKAEPVIVAPSQHAISVMDTGSPLKPGH